jgi:hypothetical protein
MKFIEYIGWLWFLATVMIVTSQMTKALIMLVWTEGSEARHVSSDEATKLLFGEFVSFLLLLKQRWMATICAFLVFFLTRRLDVGFFASFGFFSMTFVIAGILTPTILLQIKAKSSFLKFIEVFKRKP